jgi:hypothetical protein
MPKTKQKATESDPVQDFRAFLAAADRAGLDLVMREGVMMGIGGHHERSDWYDALDNLGQRFVRNFEPVGVDDVCSLDELAATQDAAYMLGLAIGLRLNGANLGLKGGAR